MAEKKEIDVFTPVNMVGFLLITMVGWIDLVGVKLFFNQRSAFMTGRASSLGENLANKNTAEALFIIGVVVISFMIGAGISAKVTKKSGLIGGLTLTGLLVIIAAIFVGPAAANMDTVKKLSGFVAQSRVILGVLLPMAFGAMNAATTLTPINRTTHLTGPATDIGINFALGNWNMVIFWLFRWIGFPLGAFIGMSLALKGVSSSLNLVISGIGIILIAMMQKATVNIPLK